MPEIKKWTDMEKGIRYLQEFAKVEMLHDSMFIPGDPHQEHDPERVRCTPNMWQRFTRTALEKHSGTLAGIYDRAKKTSFI